MMNFLRNFLTKHAPDKLFLWLVNLNNKIKARPGRVRKYNESIYIVTDGLKTIHTPRRSRLGRYHFGIDKQCALLARDYLLHNVLFETGDILIDCGANNGEIGLWANNKGLQYFAFEPEPLEAYCCDLNNYNGEAKTIRKGLWSEKTTIHWHSKPDSADSSIIEVPDSEAVTSIETITLDEFIEEQDLKKIRLFKLEAEGAEPEILQGALKSLERIDYIAVDCGYERGREKKHTFMEVYKTLTDYGFEIVDAEFQRIVFLFKKTGTL